ncbi:hypothetical protein BaRGS_00035779 [Batillaria attramentaria]|uniref:Uncharacterized protein n=1 Tax=Batillaria attramentaria TaxID=370345 RepID=A0ABD0JDK7_9CAEN
MHTNKATKQQQKAKSPHPTHKERFCLHVCVKKERKRTIKEYKRYWLTDYNHQDSNSCPTESTNTSTIRSDSASQSTLRVLVTSTDSSHIFLTCHTCDV